MADSSRLLPRNLQIKTYEAIILLVLLYGWETWSVILSGEHRLRVFENRVPRGIFGPKREEVTGGYRRQHPEQLHKLYAFINLIKSRSLRWAGHVAPKGEMRNANEILVGKLEEKGLL